MVKGSNSDWVVFAFNKLARFKYFRAALSI
jgi:hypothetical protein